MGNLKPTNDFVFKKLFGEEKNVDMLKDLVQAILPDLEIKKVEVHKDISLEKQLYTDKLGILDIVAELNDNTKINIEMQMKNFKNTIERSLFYQSGLYHESLKKGETYDEVYKTIGIWITDYDVFDEGPFHEIARLRRDYEKIVLTDKYELHYIQLTKFRKKCQRISTKLEQWLLFIVNEKLEEIKMVDNEYVQKAEKELKYLTGDEEVRRLAYLREKAIRDELSAIKMGRKEGFEEGRKKEKLENAKKMLENNIEIAIISKVTGLTEEEIEKLK